MKHCKTVHIYTNLILYNNIDHTLQNILNDGEIDKQIFYIL